MTNAIFSLEGHALILQYLNATKEEIEQAIDNLSEETTRRVQTLVISQSLLLKGLPKNLDKLVKMKSLIMEQCHHIPNLTGLEKCSRLEEVNASKCLELENISSLTGLGIKTLDISYTDLDSSSLEILSTLQNLEEVNFEGLIKPLPQAFISLLSKLNKLRILHLGGTSLKPQDVSGLTGKNIDFKETT